MHIGPRTLLKTLEMPLLMGQLLIDLCSRLYCQDYTVHYTQSAKVASPGGLMMVLLGFHLINTWGSLC